MKKLLVLVMICWAVTVNAIIVYPGHPLIKTERTHLTNGGLLQLFQGMDPKILQSENEELATRYLIPFNGKVVEYVKDKYDQDLLVFFEPDDPMILFTGFLVAHLETLQAGDAQAKYQDPFQCIYYAIGAGTGIKELVNSYTALINGGASMNTLWGLVKNFARRYVAWYLVGYTVYKFGDCMEWW